MAGFCRNQVQVGVAATFMHLSIHAELTALATVLNSYQNWKYWMLLLLVVNLWELLKKKNPMCQKLHTPKLLKIKSLFAIFFLCSPRTSTLSYIASGTAIALTTMKRKGRRRAVRLTNAHTRPRSWSVWRPSCTTNRDTQRRSRWRRREYKCTT